MLLTSLQGCAALRYADTGRASAISQAELRNNVMQVDLKDKWRNMCKADPRLSNLGKGRGTLPGPHGTPAALRLPPAEQVDENAPPGAAGAQSPQVSVSLLGLCLLLLSSLMVAAAAPGGAQLQCMGDA
jgi:hypothetical protein